MDKEKSEELASQTRLQLPSGEADLPLNGIIRRSEIIDKAEDGATRKQSTAPPAPRPSRKMPPG